MWYGKWGVYLEREKTISIMTQSLDTNKYNGKPNILIGGDVCGIQKYIYQIVSEYAAKSLKGRSFYVHLLTDAIVRYLKDNLQGAELVYNSGGSFFIIAPKEQETALDTLIKNIEDKLWARHRTSLYVAITNVDLDTQNIENGLNERFAELFDKRDRKKFNKFANKISTDYETFFTPHSMGCNNDVDEITGEYFTDDNDKTEILGNNNKMIRVRKITNKQIELGKKLRNAKFLTISSGEGGDFDFLGYQYTLNKEHGEIEFNAENVDRPYYYAGSSWNFETFDTLCQSKGEDDFKRLGVLRMDVDNLGEKFQNFTKFKDFQELSQKLDKFFGKTLDDTKNSKYSNSVFIIYSGGDDVFAVGDWEDIISFAEDVHDDFVKEFEGFTISAGVSLITLKFPIMKGAEYAGDEETKAKGHSYFSGQFEKDSVSFMDFPMNWTEEFSKIRKLKQTLYEMDNLPSAFLQKVLQLWEMADTGNINNKDKRISKTHLISNDILSIYWLIAYNLGRFRERTNDDKIKSLLDNCINECCCSNLIDRKFNGENINTIYHPLELWAFACRWAELERRTNIKQNNR